MGATIVVDQAAAAFKPEGAAHTVWCLFEKLYDKNTSPHHPEWRCVAIGRLDAAMARVFESASYCEGGMNQSRAGRIRPETYIERWLNAMKNPIVMPDIDIPLTMPELADEPRRVLARERYHALMPVHADEGTRVIEQLARGESARVALHRHPDLISVLLAEWPWRGIHSHIVTAIVGMNPRSADLGYRASAAGAGEARRVLGSAPRPEMRRVDAHARIERIDGVWKAAGWPYSIVGAYVRGLWRQELGTPGVYKRLIGEYRRAVESAAPVPNGTTVVVPLASRDARCREELMTLAEQVGGTVAGGEVRIPWVVTDSMAPTQYLLSGPDVTWEVPERSVQAADLGVEAEVEPLEQDEMEFGR